MCGGVGEEREDVEVLDERAREAVREDDRQRRRPVSALVHEVDTVAVDQRAVVREAVQLSLPLAPVEVVGPGLEEGVQIVAVGSMVPAGPGRVVRPARAPDPVAQVGQNRLVHVDRERFDRDVHRPQPTKRSTIWRSSPGFSFCKKGKRDVPLVV